MRTSVGRTAGLGLLAIWLLGGVRIHAQVWHESFSLPVDTSALAIDPSSPGTLYAAGPGVAKSTDAGGSWTPADAGIEASSVSELIFDPNHPGTLYAVSSLGVIKSTNGGASWLQMNPALKGQLALDEHTGALFANPTYYDRNIYRSTDAGVTWVHVQTLGPFRSPQFIKCDPLQSGTVYIVTALYWFIRSTDGGDTWHEIADLWKSYRGDDIAPQIVDFAVDALLPNTLYVAFNDGVYRSKNGGRGWSAVNKGLPRGGFTGLTADPTRGGVLYATTDYRGVYRTDTAGARWYRVSAGLPSGAWTTDLVASRSRPGDAYAAVQGHGVYAQTCGNAALDPGEACDDGNFVDGDGCSSRCRPEQWLDQSAQRCLKGAAANSLAVAKAQRTVSLKCLSEAAAGREADPEGCMSADAAGKVQAAAAKLATFTQAACVGPPPFGYTAPGAMSAAAAAEVRALSEDLFGPNLNNVLRNRQTDSLGAACQQGMLAAAQSLLHADAQVFAACADRRATGKQLPQVGSAVDLADCMDEVIDGVYVGKLGRALTKFYKLDYPTCFGLTSSVLFPGVCRAPVDYDYPSMISGCLIDRARCRTCRMFKAVQGWGADCDEVDNGAVDASCP